MSTKHGVPCELKCKKEEVFIFKICTLGLKQNAAVGAHAQKQHEIA